MVCHVNVDARYCVVKDEESNVLYIIAEVFREKLFQILGRELHIVAHFDGDDCFIESRLV